MDYSQMKATKTKKTPVPDIEISEKDIKKTKSVAKKLKLNWLMLIICLVVGMGIGLLGTWLATRNDTYEMLAYSNGKIDVYIGKNEKTQVYEEIGIKCIAFGKDVSKNYKVTYYYRTDLTEEEVEVEKVDETKAGIYYAVYTAPSKKYSVVRLVRNIIVLEEEDNG